MYKYSCTVYGHDADVRAVQPSPFSSLGVISASRDLSARLWERDHDRRGYHQSQTLEGHSKFVSCVAAVEPSEDHPKGLIFTGCNDNIIRVFVPTSSDAVCEMKGHTDTVCTLSAGKFQMLVSGSWDKTARVWIYSASEDGALKSNNVLTLSGHNAAIWAVLMLEQGVMATGSADKTIKIWKAGKCVDTFTGHEDCVRGLELISACQFLSCANDATIKRWTTTGECLQTYYGHTSYIYSISMLPGRTEFVTSGEDRSIRVWSLDKRDAIQVIDVPAQSAWAVTALENGDLVTALSDCTMRVFSREKELYASEADVAAYEAELASNLTKTDKGMSDIDEKDVKDMSALQTPGTKEGQVIMVRNGDKIEAHQWNENDTQWVQIGDVVSAKKSKKIHNGKEYDFVFDVDIQEGAPALKLPYNLDEDPWFAAQRFIDDNDLSQYFLEEICTFIMDNTKEARKETGQQMKAPAYADPFTGGGRYVPEGAQSESTTGKDPFTGGGRYIPDDSSSGVPNGTSTDPFTGKGRYVPGSGESNIKLGGGAASDPMINPNRYIPDEETMDTDPVPIATNLNPNTVVDEYFPKKGYITFKNVNIDAILGKLRVFSEKCGTLSESDLECLKALTVQNGASSMSSLETLWKVLSWPAEHIFPALDILRLTCIQQPESCGILCTGFTSDDDKPAKLLNLLCTFIAEPGSAKHVMANKLLSLRILCNMFESPDGAAFMTAAYKEVFQALSAGFTVGLDEQTNAKSAPFYGNKNVQISAASLLLNYSVLLSSASENDTKLSAIVQKLSRIVMSSCVEIVIVHLATGEGLSDPEAVFRYLVCLGTLITGSDNTLIKEAQELGAEKIVETTGAIHFSVSKIYECTKSLSVMLVS